MPDDYVYGWLMHIPDEKSHQDLLIIFRDDETVYPGCGDGDRVADR